MGFEQVARLTSNHAALEGKIRQKELKTQHLAKESCKRGSLLASMQIFYLLILTVQAAQCNGTASEIPVGYELQISHATRTVGIVLEQIFTNDAIYISTGDGE